MKQISKLHILSNRLTMTSKSVISNVYLNGEYFGYILEDVIRDKKIKHETAIDAGIYKVILTHSNRFNRIMPLLLNVPNFSGVRLHGGNTHKDTSGCPMIAKNRINDNMIQGSLEKELTKIISKYDECTIEIVNKFSL
jgi:hypothetical protein